MAEQEFKQHIAQHLKALRKAQGLSLDSVARLTGVSKAMLGQIERQESSPTISTLWKIASGLNASFSAFFATSSDERASDENFPEDPNMKVKAIFPYRDDTRMEVTVRHLTHAHVQLRRSREDRIVVHEN